ncbi:MAG: FtsQ-type POTRA domain-containing protein [Dehalococcoidia bacterium]|nr:FtsQ-type POTRA domain-containing protein [Dehalococcoidia bacterium]
MRNFLRNLRLPGSKPNPYPRGRVGAPSRPAPTRGLPARREPARAWSLGPAERPRTRQAPALQIPWRRIGFVSGGVLVAGLLTYGTAWLLTSDALRVRQVDVVGAQVVDPAAVAAASGVGNDSMLTLNLAEVETAIAATLPAVKSVTVTREWPQGVRVEVIEHQAWGYWQVAGQLLVVDVEGHVLEASRPAPADAPTIVEVAAPRDLREGTVGDPDTVKMVARLLADGVFERNGVRATGFIFKRDRGLTVLADGAPAAVFGDSSNYEFKVQALEAVLSQLRTSDAGSPQVAEIDLRFGRNVVMR